MSVNPPRPARICLTPRLSGVGGMVSFQHKLADGLAKRGVDVTQDLDDRPYDSILVIGGTRDLPGLWRARRRGVPILQRLDGMNWLHRLSGLRRNAQAPLGSLFRHYLRAEYGNALLSFIRARVADRIVYQSEFSRRWWEQKRGPTRQANVVIYNGVDLESYCPQGEGSPPLDRWRILMVEGSLMGGYEQGLQVAVQMVEKLAEMMAGGLVEGFPGLLELMVVGRVSENVRALWDVRMAASPHAARMRLKWAGLAPRQQIPAIDRSAHLLYSSDIHPACPNSVIEALACGLPVVAFDTGALPELVTGRAGRIVPYGGDPWRLEPPDVTALAGAALEVFRDMESFRVAARRRAEAAFGLDQMVDAYLDFLLKG